MNKREVQEAAVAQGLGAPPDRNGLAVAALILGAVGLSTSIFFVGGPLGIIGLVLGVVALITTRRTGADRGKAVAAVVTSALAIVVSALVAVLMVWYANHTQACYRPGGFHEYTQCVREQLT
ncbi:DUF4190 domain-containing protein [Streptomyces violascens]|uniref:DUF4190 domain-containing protein n=1 Tax=Streptomyces violascens TaxID=67381 RepID=UPI0036A6F34D